MVTTVLMRVLLVLPLVAATSAVTACGPGTTVAGPCPGQPAPASTPAAAPSLAAIPGALDAVAATSPGDVWAVGNDDNGPLIVHWDGSRWLVVRNPVSRAGSQGSLMSVAALSACDAWAAGAAKVDNVPMGKGPALYRTVIEHWNGRTWREMPGSAYGSLTSVTARTPDDAWAVGNSASYANYAAYDGPPLIEHWNGRAWSVTPSPHPRYGYLNGVASVSATDAWAVGTADDAPLLEHWDGRSWRLVKGPEIPDGMLFGVAAVSANDVWAVGAIGLGPQAGLVEHWDGRAWQVVRSESFAGGSMQAVSARSATDIWAVGQEQITGDQGPLSVVTRTLVEHWDGKSWRRVPSLTSDRNSGPGGVVAVSPREAWAVSAQPAGDTTVIAIQHWDGRSWTRYVR